MQRTAQHATLYLALALGLATLGAFDPAGRYAAIGGTGCETRTPPAPSWAERMLPALDELGSGLTADEGRELLAAAERSARRFDVDPLTVLAMIQVESRYDSRAVSSAGALGLMQLRPQTAQAVAHRLGIDWSSDDALFDPGLNVLLGTCYLAQLRDRFEDADVALAAYNWGPTRIARQWRARGAVPTRYVERVRQARADLERWAAANTDAIPHAS